MLLKHHSCSLQEPTERTLVREVQPVCFLGCCNSKPGRCAARLASLSGRGLLSLHISWQGTAVPLDLLHPSCCPTRDWGSTLLPLLYEQLLLVKRHPGWEELCFLQGSSKGCVWCSSNKWTSPNLAWKMLGCYDTRGMEAALSARELWAPLFGKGGRKRRVQFYSIHNFNNKIFLYTALFFYSILLRYLYPLPPGIGSLTIT